jgi:hypothetical protein
MTPTTQLQRETLYWLEVMANTPGVGNDMNAWQQLSSRVIELCRPSSTLSSHNHGSPSDV